MQPTDPFQLNKQVEEAAKAHRRFCYRLREDFDSTIELHKLRISRSVSSRAAFDATKALHEATPGKDGLVAWVAALTIERVTLEDFIEVERARRAECPPIRELGKAAQPVRKLVLDAVFSSAPQLRYAAARGVEEHADDTCSNALFWMARRQEAARQLGLLNLAELEWPVEKDLDPAAVAMAILDDTEDLAREALGSKVNWEEALARGTASEAQYGWPVRLSTRWLDDLVREGEWTRGLRLSIGPIPETLCGASYARGLSRLGAAFRRAASQRPGAPFAMSFRPFDAGPFVHGALFASWLISPAFVNKRMGIWNDAARAHLRAFSQAMLLSLRMNAAQVLIALGTEPNAVREAHEKIVGRSICGHINPELAGLLPGYDPHGAARLIGSLYGALETQRMVDEFDEDWFDNPRAQLRAREFDITKPVRMSEKDLRQCTKASASLLTRAFL